MLPVAGGSIVPRWGAAVLRPYRRGFCGGVNDTQREMAVPQLPLLLSDLLFCFADAGFQGLQGEVGLLFVD